MTRETIYSELFYLLSTVTQAVTCSRRLRHWADVAGSEQPALFMAQGAESTVRTKGLPPKWELTAHVYLYARTEDPNDTPATQVNEMLDAVCAALEPPPSGATQTLGIDGVSHAWITDIETDEGVLGEQAYAMITINILTA
jgi:hypothetical protein